jgi:peroxiredoxin
MSLVDAQAPEFTLTNAAGRRVALSEELDTGPAVVLINRGHWCSFCAEQLRTFDAVADDLRFGEDVSILPVVTSPLERVREQRDRLGLSFQPLADPDGEVADRYSGTEATSHGVTGIAATYVVDESGVVRYEQVADHPADRTYGNRVRYLIRDDLGERYEDPFGE